MTNKKEIDIQKIFEKIKEPIKTLKEKEKQTKGKRRFKKKVLYIDLSNLKFDEIQIYNIEEAPLNCSKTNFHAKFTNNTTQSFKAKRNGFTH